jgi:hypothetical protein
MVEEDMVTFGFNKTNLRKFEPHWFKSNMVNQINSCHKKSKGINQNKAVHPHHILLSKEERKNVGDVVGFVEKTIALIHFKSPPPTLTLVNYVSILKFMGTM